MSMALSCAWPLLAALSAAGFYRATSHQRLGRLLQPPFSRTVRSAAALLLAGSLTSAALLLGRWPGVFASLCAWMAACVALPALDQGLRPAAR